LAYRKVPMKIDTQQLQLPLRVYHQVFNLSRNVADLAGSEAITQVYLVETLQYKPKLN
jgi:predicted ATPase with chaperone activity